MSFSLESMIAELEDILSRDQKATKTVRQAQKALAHWKQYAYWKQHAYKCGQLPGKPE